MQEEDKRIIFNELKSLLEPFAKTLKVVIDTDKRYELYSSKPAIVSGKLRESVYFASIIIQKKFVGFYFMPVYTDPEVKELFQPELLRLLKGKSCFHIKKSDPKIFSQIEDALAKGYVIYQEKGWI
jgi:hypothetical protein